MTTKKQELTREEQSQVMRSAEEFVRDLNYSELYELALENITNEYLTKIKNSRKNTIFIYTLNKTKFEETPYECWNESKFIVDEFDIKRKFFFLFVVA